jgi:hypothetical protein
MANDDPFAGVASPVSANSADPFAGVASPVQSASPQSSTAQLPGEELFRQVGLAGRDLAGAVPLAVAGAGDIVNGAINSGIGEINKFSGTDIPKLGMPTDAVQGMISATGLFPEPQNAAERGVGSAASFLLGGGENTIPTVKTMAANLMDMLPKKAAAYDPMAAMRGISDSFNAAIDKANTFYGFPKQLAEGRSVSAPQVASHLDSVIQDVNDAPWHEAKSQVGTLQRIRDSLPDNGTVPVNDLLDLRTFTNKYFNPARMTDKAATYGKLNSVVDSGLNMAKQEVPNFEKALDIADNYWRNNVATPFLKNKVLLKSWSPEDAHNLRMVDEGNLDETPDITQQRAQNLVKNVKDVPSYNAVRRTLPDDVGQSFDAAVLKNMPTGRLQSAGKAIANTSTGHLPTALRNLADVINPGLSDAEKATIQAVKQQNTYTPLSTKNDLAQAAYENLLQAHMRGEGQSLALPAPPVRVGPVKALAAPSDAPPNYNPGVRQLSDQTFTPDARALTYQPRPDFEVSPEGWAQAPSATQIRQNPDLLGQISNAKQSTKKTSGNVAPKQLTYQPRPNFVATKEGIIEVTPRGAQGLPIDIPGELNAIRKPYKKGGTVKPSKPLRALPEHILPEDRPVRWGGRA